ncbi:hypothetical protein BB559_006633 [Furculomyces boomerangus]|uniref:Mob1/phocein n=2 Tax=Harpellales TaxID=61421 RepID=A0A2T9Y1G2_9FUNG|nr:hypothetical protein BB559_006633 [Furculomyces boomerangus]PWA01339.1 hypothetical protein BB558_002562 [Smittium angustum]
MNFFRLSKIANITRQKTSAALPPSQNVLRNSSEIPLFMKHEFASSMLVKGDFNNLVKLPKYVDLYEWLAINTFDFFNLINMFYGVVSEECTNNSCPIMSAGQSEFYWSDTQRKAIKLPATQYVDYVLSQIQTIIMDEKIFPTRAGYPFQKDFRLTLRTIFLELFRVIAHIYWNHYDVIVNLRLESHINSTFIHFIYFTSEYDLIDKKDLSSMEDFINLALP